MNIKDLDLAKLSKLTSGYNDELKCLECCKYFIAPATAACGHTLCHTCWRGRRTCPTCAKAVERKALKLNLPLQELTNRVQTLGEAFEKLFNIKLDELGLETQEELDKDPDKNVKDWLTSSQNHFSAPLQNSEPLTQESQQPLNPLEVSASNIIIHTDEKKSASALTKVSKVVHAALPQDDWDKIEPMPEVDDNPISKENIVGPMDIEPFFIDDNEYSTENPRRSSRKRDIKPDNSNQNLHEHSPNKHSSRNSSCENDKKSQKGKQTWNNVKKMRKEFSKLNKKNRNKLNVSIEMVKKTQNVKPITTSTPKIASQQIVSIDENTPETINKENNMMIVDSNGPLDMNQNTNLETNIKDKEKISDKNSIKLSDKPNTTSALVLNNDEVEKKAINKNNSLIKNLSTSKTPETHNESQDQSKIKSNMPFIKKSSLRPRNIEVTSENNLPNAELHAFSGHSDDIEISIKIGSTVTNILIKQKSDIRVKINTDREVQTSLEPDNLVQKDVSEKKEFQNIDINIDPQINLSKSAKTQLVDLKLDKSTSGKKNTASADTATAPQFEITESVEKELSNVMAYETAEGNTDASKNTKCNLQTQEKKVTPQVDEMVENLDDLNDLDIFNSGSVKEGNVHLLKEHAPSEILISTACSKLKTQKNTQKRTRETADDDMLPKYKKVKSTQQKVKDDTQPDSEPINYDAIMGQVFANIDADIEDIRKSQDVQHANETVHDKSSNNNKSINKNSSQVQKTQTIKNSNQSNSEIPATNLQEYFNERHSENVFSIMEKEDEHSGINKNDKIPQQVEDLLTPVLCRNLGASQESQDGLPKSHKSNKQSQDYDDSDRSVVEETPQKDLSIPKIKRTSTANLSQVALSETKKMPAKVSGQSIKSIINLTDTVADSNKSSRDVTVVETVGKKLTLETPLTITKFADHIIHKSTPVARKSLNFDNQNEDDDPEQTLCPTTDVLAKTTQEKEFLSKAFERTPTTPAARPLMARNIVARENRKYCLAGSCLTSAEIAKVKILCAEHKWTYVDKYTKDITHLVVGVDEEKKSQRSVKYMCALAASKWIVSFDWISSCLRSKSIANEEQFEALDSTGEPGPRRSRIAKQKLFQGIKFYCMPPFSVLDVNTLKNMLVAAGGCVAAEMSEVRVSADSAAPALLLAEPEHTQEDRFIYLAMEQGIVPVNYEWVLNCLGSYSLSSVQELLLCPSSLLPEATAQWPDVLIAQDYDYSKTE